MVFPGGTIPVPVIALVCERRVRTGLIRGGGVLASPVDGSAGRMDSEKSRPAERSTREEGKKRREDTALRWGFARCADCELGRIGGNIECGDALRLAWVGRVWASVLLQGVQHGCWWDIERVAGHRVGSVDSSELDVSGRDKVELVAVLFVEDDVDLGVNGPIMRITRYPDVLRDDPGLVDVVEDGGEIGLRIDDGEGHHLSR